MYRETTENRLRKTAESIDQLINIDISARGIIDTLYNEARSLQPEPLSLAAVHFLQRHVHPKDFVFITTGWPDQALAIPENGESDGPPGSAVLAWSLRVALKACPIIITDPFLVDGMKQVLRAVGFHCVRPEQLRDSIEYNSVPTAAVLPFPLDTEEARLEARRLTSLYKPAACIAIERGGMNEKGCIHTMRGIDTAPFQAKVDYLFQFATDSRIPTMGIGDGGNEIGMANIAQRVRDRIPNGTKCKCPCGCGITPATKVDLLVTATISNWAAYAISNLLAAVSNEPKAIHTPEKEATVLAATAAADFHDPILGMVAPSVDGCRSPIHVSMVSVLNEIIRQSLES